MTAEGVVGTIAGWDVTRLSGSAAELHALDLLAADPGLAPLVRFLDADAPALVLGSAEPAAHADADRLAARRIDLVRRRSGGGAVLVEVGTCHWVDLVIPAGHHLWDDDVGRAMHWVGELWCRALGTLGVRAEVHRGPLVRSRWTPWACFAGLGAGEVVDESGRKVVGISQRRTRAGARFQTIAYLDPAGSSSPISALVELLALEPAEQRELRAVLDATTASLSVERMALGAALVRALPAP